MSKPALKNEAEAVNLRDNYLWYDVGIFWKNCPLVDEEVQLDGTEIIGGIEHIITVRKLKQVNPRGPAP